MAVVVHVPNVFANEMANHWRADLADQVRRENKAPIQSYQHIQLPASTFTRNFFAQRGNARSDASGGISCPGLRAQIFSSAIKIPVRVLSFAARLAATGKPRAQTRTPPLVSTGQPSRSQRLMCFSFNKRFSLRAF